MFMYFHIKVNCYALWFQDTIYLVEGICENPKRWDIFV